MTGPSISGLEALGPLFQIARAGTDPSRRVADFLRAGPKADENGKWDPNNLGFEPEIQDMGRLRRSPRA